jgi:hypothetical protein
MVSLVQRIHEFHKLDADLCFKLIRDDCQFFYGCIIFRLRLSYLLVDFGEFAIKLRVGVVRADQLYTF